MFVQVINFNLEGMTEDEWHAAGRRLLEDYSQTPGLLAKVWIGNPETNTFGGIYFWQDEEALDEFNDGPLGQRIMNHPNYANVSFNRFRIVDELTKKTQQDIQVL